MARKHDVNKINLEIDNIEFWGPHEGNDGGMRVYWSSNIGFGQLDIVKPTVKSGDICKDGCSRINVYTECMDIQEDKEFTNKILSLLAEKLIVME